MVDVENESKLQSASRGNGRKSTKTNQTNPSHPTIYLSIHPQFSPDLYMRKKENSEKKKNPEKVLSSVDNNCPVTFTHSFSPSI